MKILLIEDNEHFALLLTKALKGYDYYIESVSDGLTGLEFAKAFEYDILLVDVMLPKLDGIGLCQKLRAEGYQTPILMLTANDSSNLRIQGMEAGADDYLIKPIEMRELVARIRALLRRGKEFLPTLLCWENLRLDSDTREVTYHEKRLHLTPKEYGLLELFLKNPRKIFSRAALINSIWQSSECPGEEAVTTQIKGLRQKLKAAGMTTNLIETVYGVGYRLKEEETKEASGAGEQGTKGVNEEIQYSPSSPEAEVMAIVETMWADFYEGMGERLELFEQALIHLSTGNLDNDLLQQAQAEAHRLAGSLGSYGLPMGSKVARETEFLLKTLISWRVSANLLLTRLTYLIKKLKQTLQQPLSTKGKKLKRIVVAPGSKSLLGKQEVKQRRKRKFNTPPKTHFPEQHQSDTEFPVIRDDLQPRLKDKLELFEHLLENLLTGNPEKNLLKQAQVDAYDLASSLGSSGLLESAKIVWELEFLLQALANWQKHTALFLNRFEKLIKCLKEAIKPQESEPVVFTIPRKNLELPRLLIVDCHTVLTNNIKQQAVISGFQVEVATTLTSARNIVSQQPPEIILLDIAIGDLQENSPEKALEFLSDMTQKQMEIPTIIFTASNQFHVRVEAVRLGAYAFLQKSTPVNLVVSTVEEALNQYTATKAKVMIVDDDPLVLSHVAKLLGHWDIQVTTLQNPKNFWQVLEATIPDLLILDIEMPNFNGIELCQVVRNDRRWNHLPILFLSIHSEPKMIHHLYSVGADDYVQKPVVEQEVLTRVFNRLERTKLRQKKSFQDLQLNYNFKSKLLGGAK
ncbi:MAG: response regulator [Scytonema sp. PMC 1069.18]|nr:response regulator [Scytonema sp. PMC 1069.18]MEC4882380.1 response regulator [Scytonema sp. PMC 1070.18]